MFPLKWYVRGLRQHNKCTKYNTAHHRQWMKKKLPDALPMTNILLLSLLHIQPPVHVHQVRGQTYWILSRTRGILCPACSLVVCLPVRKQYCGWERWLAGWRHYREKAGIMMGLSEMYPGNALCMYTLCRKHWESQSVNMAGILCHAHTSNLTPAPNISTPQYAGDIGARQGVRGTWNGGGEAVLEYTTAGPTSTSLSLHRVQ